MGAGVTLSLDAALEGFVPALPMAVGLSGGADSTALLLACARRWPGRVHAIHVHHGLQAAADAFEAHCTALCRELDVPLHVQRVHAQPQSGQSPEDAARQARYKAFDAVVKASSGQSAIKSVAIAHNADDQVETLLLALTRGAGVAGLAAMPAHWQRSGVRWHRPLLQVSAAYIRDWLRAQGQAWVEDPTNADERFTRNRIRRRLLPALEAAFPGFRDTWARSASHAAQAAELLDELAQQDLVQVGVPPRITSLQALGRARQANVLRCWLRVAHDTIPSAAQLAELLDQITACTTRGHCIRIKVGRGLLVRSGPVLDWSGPPVSLP